MLGDYALFPDSACVMMLKQQQKSLGNDFFTLYVSEFVYVNHPGHFITFSCGTIGMVHIIYDPGNPTEKMITKL